MGFRQRVLTVSVALSLTAALFTGSALADERSNIVTKYLHEAQKTDKNLKAFSTEEGRQFFHAKRKHTVKKEERSCTMCHTDNPKGQGKTLVGKPIEPMAPSVNKQRFTDPKKVEKWFQRNCSFVLERDCTAVEKGNYITYMMSL